MLLSRNHYMIFWIGQSSHSLTGNCKFVMASVGGGNAAAGVVEWHQRPQNPKNPVVFFDITIGTIPAGRIKMELFADITPKTAENFRYTLHLTTQKLKINSTLLLSTSVRQSFCYWLYGDGMGICIIIAYT